MIVGLGTDIVEMWRIKNSLENFGIRFVQKILHPDEVAAREKLLVDLSTEACAAFVASRFAAKEACVKALGTGFVQGISMYDIKILSMPSGKPYIKLEGKAAQVFNNLGNSLHLSISHGQDNAVAVVIVENNL